MFSAGLGRVWTAVPAQRTLARLGRNRSLVRNSAYVMATTVGTALLGFVYWSLAARWFDAAEMGLAAAIVGVMLVGGGLATMGLDSALVRALPARDDGRAWSATLNGALAAGAVAGVAGGGIVVVTLPQVSDRFGDLGDPVFAAVFVLGVVFATVGSLLDAAFTAERAAGNRLARNGVLAVGKIALLVVLPFVALGDGAIGIVGAWVGGSGVAVAVGLGLVGRLRRGYAWAWDGALGQVRGMRSSLAAHHLASVGAAAPGALLPTLAVVRASPAEAAYVYAAWMTALPFAMVAPAVATSLFAEGTHRLEGLVTATRASAWLIGVLLGPALVVGLIGGRVVLEFFGPGYAAAGFPLLVLLGVAAGPDAVTAVATGVLRARGRLRAAAALNVGMAVVALWLAWVLLPGLGAMGAGVAWTVARAMGAAVVVVSARGRWRVEPLRSTLRIGW